MCHAKSQGCSKAELLAINDDEKTHNRLKAFYALYVAHKHTKAQRMHKYTAHTQAPARKGRRGTSWAGELYLTCMTSVCKSRGERWSLVVVCLTLRLCSPLCAVCLCVLDFASVLCPVCGQRGISCGEGGDERAAAPAGPAGVGGHRHTHGRTGGQTHRIVHTE